MDEVRLARRPLPSPFRPVALLLQAPAPSKRNFGLPEPQNLEFSKGRLSFEKSPVNAVLPGLGSAYPVASMAIRSELAGYSTAEARRALEGLPRCDYDVVIKPLRYRRAPHLAARCEFEERRIVLQVPIPFRPFKEPVIYAARRKRGEGMHFAWASETVPFRGRRDVLRFLYCHEWMHWYLHEVLGKGSAAETACDRFALRNFRRRFVTSDDADAALKRRSLRARASY
jgi:hypothetical protein